MDPLETGSDRARDRFREDSLTDPGHILDQDMALTEQRYKYELNFAPLANDDAFDVIADNVGYTLNDGRIHMLTGSYARITMSRKFAGTCALGAHRRCGSEIERQTLLARTDRFRHAHDGIRSIAICSFTNHL